MSFGITMATFVAQNYGAGKIERIRIGIKQCSIISVGFSIILSKYLGFIGISMASPLAWIE